MQGWSRRHHADYVGVVDRPDRLHDHHDRTTRSAPDARCPASGASGPIATRDAARRATVTATGRSSRLQRGVSRCMANAHRHRRRSCASARAGGGQSSNRLRWRPRAGRSARGRGMKVGGAHPDLQIVSFSRPRAGWENVLCESGNPLCLGHKKGDRWRPQALRRVPGGRASDRVARAEADEWRRNRQG